MRRYAIIGAGSGVGLLVLTWFLAFHVGVFEHADQSIYSGFGGLQRPLVDHVALTIASLCDVMPYVLLAAIPVLIALLRGQPRLAGAVGGMMLGANATTEVLKTALAHPRAASLFGGAAPVGAASWPSGHATAAMVLALAMVLVVPASLRPRAAALGAVFAVVVSFSFLILGWHYPSDVFGGFLVAGIWTLLTVAALSAANERWPRRRLRREPAPDVSTRAALAPPALALLGALGLLAVVAIARPHTVLSYAQSHHAFVVGAAAIAALGLLVATGVMLMVQRDFLGAIAAQPRQAPQSASGSTLSGTHGSRQNY